MEGRSKSRFPEKCKNCIWGRFPSQFLRHYGAIFAPKTHFLLTKKLLEIIPQKRTPRISKRAGNTRLTSRMAPGKPPLAHALFKQETAVWAIVGHCSGFVAKKTWVGATKVKSLMKIQKFGPVGEGATLQLASAGTVLYDVSYDSTHANPRCSAYQLCPMHSQASFLSSSMHFVVLWRSLRVCITCPGH